MMAYARTDELDRRERPVVFLARALRIAGTRLVLALLRWHDLARERRRLLSLDDRTLKDIGITRAEAMQEGTRPFWDAHDVDRTSWR